MHPSRPLRAVRSVRFAASVPACCATLAAVVWLSGGPFAAAQTATPTFKTPPGFEVQSVYVVPKNEQGSWVSMTFDPQGRIVASDQGPKGLYRIVPPPLGSKEPAKVEPLAVKMTGAQGLHFAFGSLYVVANGGPGSGLYKLRDTDGDDQFDEVTKLKAIEGGGEHGPHAVRPGPDGKSLYVMSGNHTKTPADFDASRLPKNWAEDLLLPRQWDARGHARGILAPGGWIAKTDPEGKTWEIVSSGYRNSYDFDFDSEGEIFTYDSDMEWDMGTAWYRPTRVTHSVSGSEFGWRSGTGKWPSWSVDSLPPALDIGPGCPTGVCFGTGAKFPAKYQRALYVLDWTYGTIYAVHLSPSGSTWIGTPEEFVVRNGLPVTDAAVGPDGALYFTVGGRGTQSELFRVVYTGKDSTAPVTGTIAEGRELRDLRRKLEALHVDGPVDAAASDLIWKGLGHADRFVRYAARIALEHRPVESWAARALTESDPVARITALVALARQGKPEDGPQVLAALDQLDLAQLSVDRKLDLLRAYQLACVRLGRPEAATAKRIVSRFDASYPSDDPRLNRELCTLLVSLDSPTVIDKTLKILQAPPKQTPEQQAALLATLAKFPPNVAKIFAQPEEIDKTHFALALRAMRYGWTLEQRKAFLAWLDESRKRPGGASYVGFLDNIRKEALENASPAEREALKAQAAPPPILAEDLPKPLGPGRNWTTADIVALGKSKLAERSFERGRTAYAAAKCVQCHRFDGAGGATGPDLTNAAGRFGLQDLAEALVDPSKVVSDQYRAATIVTVAGKVHTGRVLNEVDGRLLVLTDPIDATKIVEIPKKDVESITPSTVSLMPKELLAGLNEQELLDLLAFLLSRGNDKDPVFATGGGGGK